MEAIICGGEREGLWFGAAWETGEHERADFFTNGTPQQVQQVLLRAYLWMDMTRNDKTCFSTIPTCILRIDKTGYGRMSSREPNGPVLPTPSYRPALRVYVCL